MIMLMIINIIVLIATIIAIILYFNLVKVFEEIIVKFVSQNQEYYRSQKVIIDKLSNTVIELKKSVGSVNEIKRTVSKLQSVSIMNEIDKLSSEIDKFSRESSRLSSEISKISSEHNMLNNIAKKMNKKD